MTTVFTVFQIKSHMYVFERIMCIHVIITHQDCQHNTAGDHCEKCQGGFHGNVSGAGEAASCSSCPCPLTVPSNRSVLFLPSVFSGGEEPL